VFFNGAIFVGIVSTEWEQRTVSICLISSLFLIAVLSQFFSVRRLACVTFVVFLVYVLSSLGLSLPSGLCLRSSLLVSLTGVTFG
jgi:predicted branched-subunit amino acid permease